METRKPPSPDAVNKLLSKCNQETHPPRRLALALQKSEFQLSILEVKTRRLAGFVRVTSDKGLNANLWDLVAEPTQDQAQLFTVLVHRALVILKRELPGCSVSVAAPATAIDALKAHGFLLDPGGIRAMGLRLR